MKRRTVWLGAAAAGLTAGAGTALWRSARRDDGTSPTDGDADLWSRGFETLDGARLAMGGLRGRPLVLNFWATWCAPCVVELPLLDGFYERHRGAGWQMLALAIDTPDAVRRFVADHGLKLPVALAGASGLELSRALGNVHGGLPFTVLFDSGGRPRQRHLGLLNKAILDAWREELDAKDLKLSITRRHQLQTA